MRATGWLGMSHEEAMRTNVNNIAIALEGRMEMLKSIFGSGSKDADDENATPMTPDNFRAMTQRHNARMKQG